MSVTCTCGIQKLRVKVEVSPDAIFSFSVVLGVCPFLGWLFSPPSGTCIKFYGDASWDSARRHCKAMGADLLKIGNQEMNDFVAGKT